MEKIYHLNITVHHNENEKWLSVYYRNKEKAINELKRWTNEYRTEWNVPNVSNGIWTVSEDSDIFSHSQFFNLRNGEEKYFYSGSVTECTMIDDCEDISYMCGNVWHYNDSPHILFRNNSPAVDGQECSIIDPIDMTHMCRSCIPETRSQVSLVTKEEELEYYKLRAAIRKKEDK